MTLTIHRATPADAARLAELAARTFQETFAAENRADDMALHLARTYGVAQQSAELVDPQITTLLARDGEQLAGYAQLRANRTPQCVVGRAPLELWRFYVAQSWHGRGVARALMNVVESEARARGAETLWLGVWERNERAKAFYHKCGFVDVGSQVYVVGTDAQTDRILVRSLPGSPSE
jgi:ribosomal protein S18 acetylase RimI-like enzyme